MSLKEKLISLIGQEYSYPSIKRDLALYEKALASDTLVYNKQIDVIIPSYNRLRGLKRTLNALTKFKNLRLIIVDNNSNQKTKAYLKSISNKFSNIEVVFLNKNTGGSGARIEGLKHIKSKFVAFLDNDIIPFGNYFNTLANVLINNPEVCGVQSKVVLPNGLIQINKPNFNISNKWIVFSDADSQKKYNDPSTLEQTLCNYIPIGATLWRSDIFKKYSFDAKFHTSYEDNDFGYQLFKEGYKFSNCPKAICLHIPSSFAPDKTRDYEYARFGKEHVWEAAREFYRKHMLLFAYGDIDGHTKHLGFKSKEEYMDFVTI